MTSLTMKLSEAPKASKWGRSLSDFGPSHQYDSARFLKELPMYGLEAEPKISTYSRRAETRNLCICNLIRGPVLFAKLSSTLSSRVGYTLRYSLESGRTEQKRLDSTVIYALIRQYSPSFPTRRKCA